MRVVIKSTLTLGCTLASTSEVPKGLWKISRTLNSRFLKNSLELPQEIIFQTIPYREKESSWLFCLHENASETWLGFFYWEDWGIISCRVVMFHYEVTWSSGTNHKCKPPYFCWPHTSISWLPLFKRANEIVQGFPKHGGLKSTDLHRNIFPCFNYFLQLWQIQHRSCRLW